MRQPSRIRPSLIRERGEHAAGTLNKGIPVGGNQKTRFIYVTDNLNVNVSCYREAWHKHKEK